MSIEVLEGKILTKIIRMQDPDTLIFNTTCGESFRMYHDQDCCESVWIEDICGDLDDLLHTPMVQAFEKTSTKEEINLIPCYKKQAINRLLSIIDNTDHVLDDSVTYTFYTLTTIKGTVTIRWCGTSNGYYSESVNFERTNDEH